jgi:hypothetical protein
MLKNQRNQLLLAGLLVFSFIYRVVLMLRETFPPGADIGLHNSIINSITQGGNVNFLWNNYHMGGGSSVTFPGYHIFVSDIVLLTGIPNYVAHAAVVSVFSTLIVAVAFLLTRKIWNDSAALVVAFLAAVSRFDMEMLMWGGYPNVVTLMLIPLAFYLFLERDRFSAAPFLAVTSLVCAGIFLTHSLSSVMFVAIMASLVFFTLLFAGKMGVRRSSIVMWISPMIIGVLLILPFIVQVTPAYLGADAATFTGGVTAIRDALLSTKLMPLDIVLPLLGFVFLYFVFSKYYQGKFVTLPTILMVLWWLIPTVLTQGYLVGLYTDYQRFLYFVVLPILMLLGLGLYHCARFFAQASEWAIARAVQSPQVRISKNKILRFLPKLQNRNWAALFMLVLLLYVFFSVPLFVSPVDGIGVQTFYQLMDQPKFEAIQWAQTNTPADAVFLTDAQYGWWFGGFAQRPTISAVEPQYLTNSREFEPATIANRVLDTDYLIDNGLIQVREDGGYIGRHNPNFLVKLEGEYFPYGMFTFDNQDIQITFRIANGSESEMYLSEVPVISQRIENSSSAASICVTRANEYFACIMKTTVYQGCNFANITFTLASTASGTTFDYAKFVVHKSGFFVQGNSSTVGLVDSNMKAIGELIFNTNQTLPETKLFTSENQAALQVSYSLEGKADVELNFYAGAFEYSANPSKELTSEQQTAVYQQMIMERAVTYDKSVANPELLDVFNYQQALASLNVSYVALRDAGQINRFLKDSTFSLVFINNEVAIFRVNT